MQTNLPITIIVILLALGLVVFTIFRNKKDEVDFEKNMNERDSVIEKHQEDEDIT